MSDEEDRWFWNDELYREYLLNLPRLGPRHGTIRYTDTPDLSKIRTEDFE